MSKEEVINSLAQARYEYQEVKHKALAVLLLYRLNVQPAGMEVKVGGFAGCVCTCTRTLQVPRRCTRGRPMQAHVQSTRCMCSICTESLVHLTYMHVRNRDLISLPHDSCSSKSSGSRNRYVPRPGPSSANPWPVLWAGSLWGELKGPINHQRC
ncbi:hypothetical protein HDV62DRAFT_194684 [Trichoderma sp. SZMC 28011]